MDANLLAKHPLIAGLEASMIATISMFSRTMDFNPDEHLMRVGDESSTLYLIYTGHVALELTPNGRPRPVETVGEGSIVGLSWLFPPYRSQLQARAIDKVSTVAVEAARLRRAMKEDHVFDCALSHRMLRVVYARLEATRKQLLGAYSSSP
ncbi:MAG: Crp/Fnr family transcriptional regulator [Polyangiales bacterium]